MRGCVVFWGLVLATVLVSEVRHCEAGDLAIAAFNVQIFGQKKIKDAFVMETLVKIIKRYDIILIQEIRDSKETAIFTLLDKVNEASTSNPFDITVSPRMGRSWSKEQYAFLYRTGSGLRVKNVYVYDDGDELSSNKSQNIIVDTFEREPYIIHFSSSNTDLKEFALCGIHVAPDEAVHEIKALKEVFVDIQQKFRISDIMVMGDLNADCSYVPKKSWAEISLKSDPSYHWLLGDAEDTTVSASDCAYDRFIGKGDGFSMAESGGVVAGSARVFNYMQEYGLTLEKALDVSDHYPIEFKLKGRGGKTSRLRSAHILNAHVLVSGSSLKKDGKYFVGGINLDVMKEDGTVVGSLYDGTKRDRDECLAIKVLILDGLHKNRIRVEMLRTRSWRKRQLCKIIVQFTEDMHPKVKVVLDQYLKVYGNVIYI